MAQSSIASCTDGEAQPEQTASALKYRKHRTRRILEHRIEGLPGCFAFGGHLSQFMAALPGDVRRANKNKNARGLRVSKTIKVGGIYVEVPDDSPLASGPVSDSPLPLTAEKPEEPEKLESGQYVYRPNDPFQSSIDRVVVLGNVHSVGKPWVKKAFMFFFVILPFTCVEIAAISALFNESSNSRLGDFLFVNFLGMFAWAPYLLIWWRTRAKKAAA